MVAAWRCCGGSIPWKGLRRQNITCCCAFVLPVVFLMFLGWEVDMLACQAEAPPHGSVCNPLRLMNSHLGL
jgi:hypothetical protein